MSLATTIDGNDCDAPRMGRRTMTVEPTQADRELLAAEYDNMGATTLAGEVRSGATKKHYPSRLASLCAIAKLRIENERLAGELAAANAKLARLYEAEDIAADAAWDASDIETTASFLGKVAFRAILEYVNEPAKGQDQ